MTSHPSLSAIADRRCPHDFPHLSDNLPPPTPARRQEFGVYGEIENILNGGKKGNIIFEEVRAIDELLKKCPGRPADDDGTYGVGKKKKHWVDYGEKGIYQIRLKVKRPPPPPPVVLVHDILVPFEVKRATALFTEAAGGDADGAVGPVEFKKLTKRLMGEQKVTHG